MNANKHIITSFFGLLLIIFSACNEELDDIGNPELAVMVPTTAPAVAYPNKPVSFPVEIKATTGIDKVLTKVGFQALDGTEKSEFNGNTGIYNFSYTPTDDEIGQTLEFIIVAYDKEGFTSTSTYKLAVELEPVNITINLPAVLPDTVEVGDIISFTMGVASEDEIATIETLYNDAVLEELTMNTFENKFSATYHFEYLTNAEDGGKDAIFTFKVTDIEGKREQVDYTVHVKGQRLPLPVVTYSGIILGFQSNTTVGPFFDFESNTVYTVPEGSNNSGAVDMGVFRSGSASGINLFAPNFANAANYIYNEANWGEDNLGSWAIRNDTQFIYLSPDLMSLEEYQALEDDQAIVDIFEAGTATTINVAKLAVDDLIAFKTVDGKYGVMHVKSFVSAPDGEFTFDYKTSE